MKVSAGKYLYGWCLNAAAIMSCMVFVSSCASTRQSPQAVHSPSAPSVAEKAAALPLDFSDNASYTAEKTQSPDPYHDPWDHYYYSLYYDDYYFYDPFYYGLYSPYYYPYWYAYGPYYFIEDDDDFCRHHHDTPRVREKVRDFVQRQQERREDRWHRAEAFLRERQKKRAERFEHTTEKLRDIARNVRERREDRLERARDAFPSFNMRNPDRPELFRERPVFNRSRLSDDGPFFGREPPEAGLFRNLRRR